MRAAAREVLLVVVLGAVLTLLVQTFVARVFVIPSESMEPTLHGCPGCTGDRVLVDRTRYLFREPAPGDVVVFRGPDGWTDELRDDEDFVKRVIAVGGQTVRCCDGRGRVLVDGRPLHEPYLRPGPPDRTQPAFGPVTVPPGHLWLLGDNRDRSADSRVPGRGAVPADAVVGEVRWILLPFPRSGPLPPAR